LIAYVGGGAPTTGPTGWLSLEQVFYSTKAYTPIPTLNGWATYGSGYDTLGYSKDGSFVFIGGLIKNTVMTGSTTVGMVPVQYANEYREVFTVTCYNVVARVDVNSTGHIVFSGSPGMTGKSGWLSLDGIAYLPSGASFNNVAMNGTWHAIGVPYPPLQVTVADSLVVLRGVVSAGTITSIGTLEPQYRPLRERTFIVVCGRTTYYYCRINVYPTGTIALVGLTYPTSWPTWVSLSGVSFDQAPTLAKRATVLEGEKPVLVEAATESAGEMRVNSETIAEHDLVSESFDALWHEDLRAHLFDSTTK